MADFQTLLLIQTCYTCCCYVGSEVETAKSTLQEFSSSPCRDAASLCFSTDWPKNVE